MTEKVPFAEENRHTVIHKVLKGDRPERPNNAAAIGLSDSVWKIAEGCWREERAKRTTIQVVLEQLNEAVQHWVPPSVLAADHSEAPSSLFTRGKLISLNFFDDLSTSYVDSIPTDIINANSEGQQYLKSLLKLIHTNSCGRCGSYLYR